MKNKKFSILGLILIIVGVAVIVFGSVAKFDKKQSTPEVKEPVGTYNYETDLDFGKVKYEFEIITNEEINTNGVYLIVSKTGEVESERIKLNFKSHPDNDDGYKFVVTLDSDKYFGLREKEMAIETYNLSGQKISITYDPFEKPLQEFEVLKTNAGKTFLKAGFISVGSILTIVGVVLMVVKAKSKTQEYTEYNVGDLNSKAEPLKNSNKKCGYCGSINKQGTLKCEECGAPLEK